MTEDVPDGVETSDAEPDDAAPADDATRANGNEAATGPDSIGLVEARTVALERAETVLSDPVDSVIEVAADGDDWLVAVEVVERSAVPNTQDLLGRYELTVGADGQLAGYELVGRYKRADLHG